MCGPCEPRRMTGASPRRSTRDRILAANRTAATPTRNLTSPARRCMIRTDVSRPFSWKYMMFGSLGMPELIVIFLIALIIFGPRKLPELGRSLGKSIAEFKKASNELRSTLEEEIRIEEQRSNLEATKTASATAPPAPVTAPPEESMPVRKADHSA